jgi:deoxyribonuclease-4
MIRFGPGGIPLSCKGRTQRDGIEDVHTLGLNAMEIQFVRVNLFERYAADEEIGLRPREVAGEFVVDVLRGRKPLSVFGGDVRLEKGDIVRTLNCGVGRDTADFREIGEIADDLDVSISLHAPYYMDLLGSDEIGGRSVENIRYGGLVAREIGADMLVTHLGFYHENSPEAALEKVAARLKELRDWFDRMGVRAKLGLECSGKRVVFGGVDEILAVCKRVPGVVPVLSFPHIHAREGGSLKRREDFRELFDKVRDALKLQSFYTHFSGVEHEGGNELRYTPIKKGDMRFEPLAEYLADESADITIISDSPLLEHDAMYMKVILERVQLKNEAKVTREEVKVTAPIKPPSKPIAPPKKGKAPAKPAKKAPPKKPAKKPAKAPPKKAAKKAAPKKPAKAPAKKPAKKAPPKKPAKKPAPKKPAKAKPKKKK